MLTSIAMKHETVREIVKKRTFKCKLFNRTFAHFKEIIWENTNKLLRLDGFVGVKTGVTPAAGPCLSSMFQFSPEESFVVIILKTTSCENRFRQTLNLLKTVFQKMLVDESGARQSRYRRAIGEF